MIEFSPAVSGTTAATAASASAPAAVAPPRFDKVGWDSLGLAGPGAAGASGADRRPAGSAWAQGWSQLSELFNNAFGDMTRVADTKAVSGDPTSAAMSMMDRAVEASAQMTRASMQMNMVTNVVQSGTQATDKLLRQQ